MTIRSARRPPRCFATQSSSERSGMMLIRLLSPFASISARATSATASFISQPTSARPGGEHAKEAKASAYVENKRAPPLRAVKCSTAVRLIGRQHCAAALSIAHIILYLWRLQLWQRLHPVQHA